MASEIVFQPLYSDTGAPLREERVITVRKKPNSHLEVYERGVTGGMRSPIMSCDSQHVTLHVPLTPETKDPISEELLMKMRKGLTLINTSCLEGCTRQQCLRFSVREQTSVTSPCYTGMPRQPKHLDSRTQNSSPRSYRVHIKRGV